MNVSLIKGIEDEIFEACMCLATIKLLLNEVEPSEEKEKAIQSIRDRFEKEMKTCLK